MDRGEKSEIAVAVRHGGCINSLVHQSRLVGDVHTNVPWVCIIKLVRLVVKSSKDLYSCIRLHERETSEVVKSEKQNEGQWKK